MADTGTLEQLYVDIRAAVEAHVNTNITGMPWKGENDGQEIANVEVGAFPLWGRISINYNPAFQAVITGNTKQGGGDAGSVLLAFHVSPGDGTGVLDAKLGVGLLQMRQVYLQVGGLANWVFLKEPYQVFYGPVGNWFQGNLLCPWEYTRMAKHSSE